MIFGTYHLDEHLKIASCWVLIELVKADTINNIQIRYILETISLLPCSHTARQMRKSVSRYLNANGVISMMWDLKSPYDLLMTRKFNFVNQNVRLRRQ